MKLRSFGALPAPQDDSSLKWWEWARRARNRVGGRVKAGTIAGRKVDVGGMWAAATQTRVLELIKEFGCELVPQFEAGDRLR
ncbi:MAG TPA: FAD-dependent oxidoreductase, partial [Candidatus Acidoferrum sp.]|nr:FAD-dependent oxidoreductase [Candidatus Acidoferrum sp.]